MGIHPRNGLSLCAGGGGLDLGVMLAKPGFRTQCYVEIEEYPRQVLVAGMRNGYLEPAPIWDDITTFCAKPFAGSIDTVIAGYPCQPFSSAGRRKGETDERHLWPHVARIIGELGSACTTVILENVAGHLSLGLETVLRELREMGFKVAAGLFSAAEVGASHLRERVFILAYRESDNRGRELEARGTGIRRARPPRDRQKLGDTGANANPGGLGSRSSQRETSRNQSPIQGARQSQRERIRDWFGRSSEYVDHSTSPRQVGERERPETHGQGRKRVLGEGCGDMANRIGERSQGFGGDELDRDQPRWEREIPDRSIGESGVPVHAPPPGDREVWDAIIARAPDRAPAISRADAAAAALDFAALFDFIAQRQKMSGTSDLPNPAKLGEMGVKTSQILEAKTAFTGFCRMADGLASRTRALRLLGNGVHPLAAAHAFRTLETAHFPALIDMEGTGAAP